MVRRIEGGKNEERSYWGQNRENANAQYAGDAM